MSRYSMFDFLLESLATVCELAGERLKTQSKKRRLRKTREREVWENHLWEQRVKFVSKLKQLETRTFHRLLAAGVDDDLILEATDLLLNETSTRLSNFLDIWRSARDRGESLQQVREREEVDITHPDDFKGPHRYARNILRRVRMSYGQ